MKRFDKKLNAQDIINAIPGGVAIYKVSDIFERFTILTAYPLFPAIAAMNMTCS